MVRRRAGQEGRDRNRVKDHLIPWYSCTCEVSKPPKRKSIVPAHMRHRITLRPPSLADSTGLDTSCHLDGMGAGGGDEGFIQSAHVIDVILPDDGRKKEQGKKERRWSERPQVVAATVRDGRGAGTRRISTY